MHVAFDSQIFCSQQFGGISRYFASLAGEMTRMPGVAPRIVAPLYFNEYLDRLPAGLVQGCKTPLLPKTAMLIRVASVLAGDVALRCGGFDLVHKTYYYPLPGTPRRARSVVTVYDMIHEKFPQNYSRKDPIRTWKKRAVDSADHVICISEHTRRDLLDIYPISPEKVSVTHLGYDSMAGLVLPESDASFRSRIFGADRPYILYVGSRQGYKNFAGLLRAYAASPWLRDSFALMCFGSGAFTAGELAEMLRLGVAEKVYQVGGGDSVLATCYKHAALFVYPSMYEGFGIPPLEAMSLDCPVACSNTSSIPEVVGDAAAHFDPVDPDAIREVIEAVLNASERASSLVERGRLRREMFSWQRCAEETVGIYRRVLGE